jgi:hypothetical protein
MIAITPTMSKNGNRPVIKDTLGRFTKANPDNILAKNNNANGFIFHPSL